MKKYKILSDAGENKLQVEASTLEELFEAAMTGLNKINRNPESASEKQMEGSEPDTEKKVNLKAEDAKSLLVAFLAELLKISQEEKAVFTKALFLDFDEKNIDAEIYGYRVEELGENLQSKINCENKIEKNKKGNWETVILVS